MMKVLIGHELPDTLTMPDKYFNHVYEDNWLADPVVKQMVKDVDKSDLVDQCVISPVLGQIAPERLSGGVKALILLLKEDNPECYINMTACGQNCAKWLAYISTHRDCVCVQTGFHIDFTDMDVDILCLNNGEHIKDGITWAMKQEEFGESYYDEIAEKQWYSSWEKQWGYLL